MRPRGVPGLRAPASAGEGAHERQDAVGHPLGEGDLRAGALHTRGADDPLDHLLQVRVGPGDHPGPEVAVAGDAVHLDDLGDGLQSRGDVVQAALRDVQGDERVHVEAQRLRVHVRGEPDDHPALLQPQEARLGGAAGDAERPRVLAEAGPRAFEQREQQGAVEVVEVHVSSIGRRGSVGGPQRWTIGPVDLDDTRPLESNSLPFVTPREAWPDAGDHPPGRPPAEEVCHDRRRPPAHVRRPPR